MRWRRADEARLQRLFGGFAEFAAELGRTEAAIRRKRSRLLQRRRADRRLWPLGTFARHAGYDPSVIERVAQRFGHEWFSNGRTGSAARYWLTPRQAEEVLKHLVREANWSRHVAGCLRCGTSTVPHHARGLCRRCYAPRARTKGGEGMKK
jgi:hypothetical protein